MNNMPVVATAFGMCCDVLRREEDNPLAAMSASLALRHLLQSSLTPAIPVGREEKVWIGRGNNVIVTHCGGVHL
jgi:hypothetical protein